MDFEYDPAKNAINLQKHGIGFDEAQTVWNDPARFELPAASLVEDRLRVIGMARGKLWSVCFTMRQGRVRIISVRRARDNERATYDERIGKEGTPDDGRE